jgi:hypothetical protein
MNITFTISQLDMCSCVCVGRGLGEGPKEVLESRNSLQLIYFHV